MNPTAILTPKEREENNRRQNTYTLCWVSCLLAGCAVYAGIFKFTAWGHAHLLKTFDPVWFIFFTIAISLSFANWVCRKAGLSLEHDAIETFRRGTPLSQPFEALNESPVEPPSTAVFKPLYYSRNFSAYFVPAFWTIVASFLSLLALQKPDCLGNLFIAPFIAGSAVAAVRSWKNRREPKLAINERGVRWCSKGGIRLKSASWGDIDSCDLVTPHDIFGKAIKRVLRLKDSNGHKLFDLPQTATTPDEIEKFECIADSIALKLSGRLRRADNVSIDLTPEKNEKSKQLSRQTWRRLVAGEVTAPSAEIILEPVQMEYKADALLYAVLLLAGAFCTLIPVYDHDHLEFAEHPWLCALALILIATALFGLRNFGRPHMKMDETGIQYSPYDGQRKYLAWDDIACCDFITIRRVIDRFHKPIVKNEIILRDEYGKELLRIKASNSHETQDQEIIERAARYISIKLTGREPSDNSTEQ